jgi:flagellar hook-basal body complex protein FliE
MIEGIFPTGPSSPSAVVRSPPPTAASATGPSFGEALTQAIGSAVDTLQAGEAAAIQGIEGAAAPMKVVESVMAAQRSLQMVLAMRDKAVGAYQEIARMTI